MKHLKLALVLTATGAALLAQPAYAHGFGDRYDLPVPLGYFMVGAGAAVALSFVVIGLLTRSADVGEAYWRLDLLSKRWIGAALTSPLLSVAVRPASVGLLGLVVATGFAGSQKPELNFAPTFVWVIWWVGMGFFAALVGNLWALVNPWKAIFEWAEWAFQLFRPGASLSLNDEYPPEWGYWPAVLLFLGFAWLENAYSDSALPSRVALMAVAYSVVTLGGMVLFGKHQWLRHGEVFSVVFSLLARFSPTEVRVTRRDFCMQCSGACASGSGDCVDCYECFEAAAAPVGSGLSLGPPAEPSDAPALNGTRQLNIRPFAVGLSRSSAVSPSALAVVVLLLATVTFDGFSATPAWSDVQTWSLDLFSGTFNSSIFNGITIADTLGLLLLPVAFLLVYLTFVYLMAKSVGGIVGTADLAMAFVYSLVPIALAYNIAHFVNLLVVEGQLIIPLASDPFGSGWDLFGTTGYVKEINVIGARVLWFLSVGVIVTGHFIAVYLAHVVAVRRFRDRATALRSQYPMLGLMVMYTVVSLWIIAQPIVN